MSPKQSCVHDSHGHGRLLDPPSRATMWRAGYDTPHDYDDNQSFCGGVAVQYSEAVGGRCGICGDPYPAPEPREHEAGGTYGSTGIIVGSYEKGGDVPVTVELTANHLGYFTFRLCPTNNWEQDGDESCFERSVVFLLLLLLLLLLVSVLVFLLLLLQHFFFYYYCTVAADVAELRTAAVVVVAAPAYQKNHILFIPIFYIRFSHDLEFDYDDGHTPESSEIGLYHVTVHLPDDIDCFQCVLQWTYKAGNSWGVGGVCGEGVEGMGCGDQVTHLEILAGFFISQRLRRFKTYSVSCHFSTRFFSVCPTKVRLHW